MTEIEFVKALKEIPSQKTIEVYKTMGLDDDFITEYLNNYKFKILGRNKEYCDPIKNLVNNYDGSTVTLGMITFNIDPEEDEDYYFFGCFEVDYLVINKNLKTIEMLEYGEQDHVLCKCASSSSRFLEAILLAAQFAEKCGSDEVLYNDKDANILVIEECASLAGGDEYIDFYKMMLGYSD